MVKTILVSLLVIIVTANTASSRALIRMTPRNLRIDTNRTKSAPREPVSRMISDLHIGRPLVGSYHEDSHTVTTPGHLETTTPPKYSDLICPLFCQAGLGGVPCGCPSDQVANDLERTMEEWQQEQVNNGNHIYAPRRELCPVLCGRGLGLPLCGCTNISDPNPPVETDWCPLCFALINSPNLWIEVGCNKTPLLEKCKDYEGKNKTQTYSKSKRDVVMLDEEQRQFVAYSENKHSQNYVGNDDGKGIDWDLWCRIQCEDNNGGLACNCDKLPLALAFHKP